MTAPSSPTKRTKRASSMPWASAGPCGQSTRSDNLRPNWELDCVVVGRHPADSPATASLTAALDRRSGCSDGDGQVEFRRLEDGPEAVEDQGGGLIIAASFGQLGMEEPPAVRPGRVSAVAEELTRVIETDCPGRVDSACAELDRRDVALAHGPQAHDETRLARGQAALVGVGDHGRVEQGRTFERYLAGEVSADEEFLVGRDIVDRRRDAGRRGESGSTTWPRGGGGGGQTVASGQRGWP